DGSAAITEDGDLHYWDPDGKLLTNVTHSSHVAIATSVVGVYKGTTHTTSIMTLPANSSSVHYIATLPDILPGRRYKYTITASNSIGSATYRNTFTAQFLRTYDVYVPVVLNQ
ncbi:MAG: hypothetical protein ACK46D_01930, partial [Roseiflexaceae bacterium]